ncbi:MAG: hypothetical protein NDJ19_06200 [Ramlibacter sp.]|nr:hypothetical protein [Ramlibacter sp.]
MKSYKFLALIGLTALASAAMAADVAYEFVACTHGKAVMLEGSSEFAAFGLEEWGLVANSKAPEFEKASTHCVGALRMAGPRPVGKGLCKWTFADGATAVGEWEMPPAGENSFTWLNGSGRLKGIKGGGSFQQVVMGATVDPGTSQSCRRDWGKYTIPG